MIRAHLDRLLPARGSVVAAVHVLRLRLRRHLTDAQDAVLPRPVSVGGRRDGP